MTTDLLIGPTCLLIGLYAGASLAHRARTGQNPLPDVMGTVRSAIEAVLPKRRDKKQRVEMKQRRA